MATPVGQSQAPALVHHGMQAPGPLPWGPTDLPLAGPGVRGRPAHGDEGHPIGTDLGHVARAAPARPGTVPHLRSSGWSHGFHPVWAASMRIRAQASASESAR